MNAPQPIPYDAKSSWPEPNLKRLAPDTPPPPVLPLTDVLTPNAARWVADTAEGAGAPADYVFGTLLTVAGSAMGNARWVSPWRGWYEPPTIWSMHVGNPSAGKSPAIDAGLSALRAAEKPIRQKAEMEHESWELAEDHAKLALSVWEGAVRKALAKGEAAPPRPDGAASQAEPHIPRLMVHDGTVERLGVIAEAQPKGFLQFRDELSGFLRIMESRNGGSDRAFWLEAYGGKSFSVERIGRRPLSIDRLTIAVCGGIQPQPLRDLLINSTDDGLLARFIPIWPEPAPIKRPERYADTALAETAIAKLAALPMPTDDDGQPRPWFCGFDSFAAGAMDDWRVQCREWEANADGLLLGFVGKLPGMAARLSLVLSAIGHGFDDEAEPGTADIGIEKFGRACHLIESYVLPMARRAYAAGSVTKKECAASHLLANIQRNGWERFTTRDVARKGWKGLKSEVEIKAVMAILSEADIIRQCETPPGPRGGRPTVTFEVNPRLREAAR